jgi:hypothetical protein
MSADLRCAKPDDSDVGSAGSEHVGPAAGLLRIIDLSAGNRAVWFDKTCPLATYVDIRPEVEPDVVADSRALPPAIGAGYDLVVFDPPHKNSAASGNMSKNYGHHTAEEITDIIRRTAAEAHRVTTPRGLMAFKWNDHTRKLSSVLPLLAPYWLPLFGHGVSHQQRASQTSWVMLLRSEATR